MPAIHVITHGDHERVGREVGVNRYEVIHTTADWTLDALEHGMASGATSLMVLIPANRDGVDVLLAIETSLTMWMQAVTILAAKFRDEVEKPGWVKLSPAARALFLPRLTEAVRRAIPVATVDQASDAAEMILDSFGADAPGEVL